MSGVGQERELFYAEVLPFCSGILVVVLPRDALQRDLNTLLVWLTVFVF